MSEDYTFEGMQRYKQSDQYKDSLNDTPWYLEEGVKMIRDMQERAWSKGFHLNLGGGVLNKGYSRSDLDILVMYGLYEESYDRLGLVNEFKYHYDLRLEDTVEKCDVITVYKLRENNPLGRRIDLVFLNNPVRGYQLV